MPQLWLSPIRTYEPFTIGADRLAIDANTPEWLTFRQSLQAIHPRLLPLFKSQLLLDGEDGTDGYCGSEQEMEFEQEGDIVFDGAMGWKLSHCAESFLDRLLAPEEALKLWYTADDEPRGLWAETILNWWRQGWTPILFADR